MQPWNGRCPDCHGTQWLEGPEGGLCINLKCPTCGARINVARIPGVPLYERIDGKPEKVVLVPVQDPDEARTAGGGGSPVVWLLAGVLLAGSIGLLLWIGFNAHGVRVSLW